MKLTDLNNQQKEIIFNNEKVNFSPKVVSSKGIKGWKLTITDKNGKPFKTFSGTEIIPDSIIWDGKGDKGEMPESGETYMYSLIVVDNSGRKVQTSIQTIEIAVKYVVETRGIVMNLNVEFDSGMATIKPESSKILKKASLILQQYPSAKVSIEGHTDNIPLRKGKLFKNNIELSKARAESVKKFFVKNLGIDENRLSTKGWGETKPIASNKTPEGRQKNRRVEIIISTK